MDVWHSRLNYWKNCSVHPQDMSSTCLSDFWHTSPLSRNGFPFVASAHRANSSIGVGYDATGELVTQKSFHACKYGGFIEFYTSGEEYHGQKENGKIIKE